MTQDYKQQIELDGYINIWEVIPEDEHSHISNKIWEALDRAGIELSQDAELSIKVYDEIDDEIADPWEVSNDD